MESSEKFQVKTVKEDDGDELLQCPLNSSHMILRSRMNRHIMKCMKSNYRGKEPLIFCPFNSMHLFTAKDMINHIQECPDHMVNSQRDAVPE